MCEIYGVLNVWLAHCELLCKREKQNRNTFHLEYFKSLHKLVEYDRPGDGSPDASTDVSTTSAVVIFRLKMSCITLVGGNLFMVIYLSNLLSPDVIGRLSVSRDVVGYGFRSVLTVVYLWTI